MKTDEADAGVGAELPLILAAFADACRLSEGLLGPGHFAEWSSISTSKSTTSASIGDAAKSRRIGMGAVVGVFLPLGWVWWGS